MQKAKSGPKSVWNTVRTAGMLMAVIGAAIAAYGFYGWFSAPANYGLQRYQYPSGGANASNMTFNQSGFGSVVQPAGFGMANSRSGFYEAVIGILTALLGIVTFKYAGLKAVTVK